jgi:hypothetical protein
MLFQKNSSRFSDTSPKTGFTTLSAQQAECQLTTGRQWLRLSVSAYNTVQKQGRSPCFSKYCKFENETGLTNHAFL